MKHIDEIIEMYGNKQDDAWKQIQVLWQKQKRCTDAKQLAKLHLEEAHQWHIRDMAAWNISRCMQYIIDCYDFKQGLCEKPTLWLGVPLQT